MKKVSIYWKTIGISIAIILLTTGILLGLFSVLAPTLTQKIQEDAFTSDVRSLYAEIEEQGFNEEVLEEASKNGLFVYVYDGMELIYPRYTYSAISFYQTEDSLDAKEYILESDLALIVETSEESSVLIEEGSVIVAGKTYTIFIQKVLSFTTSDAKLLIENIYPYFIGVGIVVSIVLSVLYSRFFASKIKHLVIVMQEMKEKKYRKEPEEIGDELQRLENDIASLYYQLIDEIEVVKKLEEERQLFLRGVTHELKTPIMTMGVTIEGVLAGIEEYENVEESLQECYQELQRMSNLVNEILDIAKIESVKDIASVVVSDVVLETMHDYEYLLEDKKQEVEIKIEKEMELKMPKNHFRKIVSNMFSNIIKYMPVANIATIYITENSLHFINPMYEDTNIDITRIFEAFVTYDEKNDHFQKSHGLGLYITASILKQYQLEYRCWVDEEKQFHFQIEKP